MSAVASPRDEHVLAAIDAHFAGRTSVAAEATMRAHLPACPTCREAYQRHLVVAELDPRAISAQDRLGKALGFRMKPRRPLGALAGGGGGSGRGRGQLRAAVGWG